MALEMAPAPVIITQLNNLFIKQCDFFLISGVIFRTLEMAPASAIRVSQ